ncbi:MAG: hypothetical protein EOP58_08360 [Sphingomonadales bacterium]|nr:MAG: hypothetical protein EOP58_08360 [Sphingomonadales bacterium]
MIEVLALIVAMAAGDADQRIAGPAIACGAAFSIQLQKGEALEWRDTRMDFLVYRFRQGDKVTVIYEGNAPQPGGIVHNTGRDAPSKVVVHGSKEVAARLRFDGSERSKCPTKTPKW